jgi:hypothetical protein
MYYRRFGRNRALDPLRQKGIRILRVMARRGSWLACGATLYVAAAGAHAQAPAEHMARAGSSCADEDGCFLSSEPLTLTKTYAQLDDLSKFRFPRRSTTKPGTSETSSA